MVTIVFDWITVFCRLIMNYSRSLSQIYPVAQRAQDSASSHDPGHHFQRHDAGEGDADAEGERDYEVG